MTKLGPVLGTIVLVGAIAQVILGLQVTAGMDSLTMLHAAIGVTGFVLVIALTAIAFKSKTTTLPSKAIMIVLALVVLIQVMMGFQLLNGTESLMGSHMFTGFFVVVLALSAGGVTMMSARKRVRMT